MKIWSPTPDLLNQKIQNGTTAIRLCVYVLNSPYLLQFDDQSFTISINYQSIFCPHFILLCFSLHQSLPYFLFFWLNITNSFQLKSLGVFVSGRGNNPPLVSLLLSCLISNIILSDLSSSSNLKKVVLFHWLSLFLTLYNLFSSLIFHFLKLF